MLNELFYITENIMKIYGLYIFWLITTRKYTKGTRKEKYSEGTSDRETSSDTKLSNLLNFFLLT
jgi:hypothetical protein